MRKNKNTSQAALEGGWVEVKGKRRGTREKEKAGDAAPPPLFQENPPTRKVTWAGKVRGKPVQGVRKRGVGEFSSASPSCSSSPRQQGRVGELQEASGVAWQGSESAGEARREREEAAEEEWDMHSNLTWAEQVDLSQEVWYGPDGVVVGVGPPSLSSPPLNALPPRPSYPAHAHADALSSLASSRQASIPAQRKRAWERSEKSASSPSYVHRGPTSMPPPQRWAKGEGEHSGRNGNRNRWVVLERKQGNISAWDEGDGSKMKRGSVTEETEEGIKVKSEQRNVTEREETVKQRNRIYIERRSEANRKEQENGKERCGKDKEREKEEEEEQKEDNVTQIEERSKGGGRRRKRRGGKKRGGKCGEEVGEKKI